MAVLRVWLPDGEVRDFPVAEGKTELGCQPAERPAIQLPSTGNVSRRHAVLSGKGTSWSLEDMSTNGTKVDGADLNKGSHPLRDGAQILFADVRATFLLKVQDPEPEVPVRGTPILPGDPPPPPDLIRELREGAVFLRNYATLADTSVERLKEALRVLDRAVVDPDPEIARAALARQLEERGTLSRDVHNLDEILRDFSDTLASFEKTLARAASGSRR